MVQPFRFEAGSFKTNSELLNESWELNPEFFEEEWQGEMNQNSPEFVRWVQNSLNKAMGLRLSVDGVMGPMTRSAIRSFQQKKGLAVDGNVGPKTETALKAGGTITQQSVSGQTSRTAQILGQTVPAYTQCDFIDPRIDVDAQYALFEMLKGDISTQRAAVNIFSSIKRNNLGGIFKEDQVIPAKRAQEFRLGWWQLIPTGLNAACIEPVKNDDLRIIVFRKSIKNRLLLGQAIKEAWFNCGTESPIPYPPSGKLCPMRPPPPPPPDPVKPTYIWPDINPVHPQPTDPTTCDLTAYEILKNKFYKQAFSSIAGCAVQFGVDEASAISLAVSVLGTALAASKIPPVAVIVAIIGGSATIFLDLKAKGSLAYCIYGVLQRYMSDMANAKKTTNCL